ncbi:MAG: hypothetical protein KDA84_11805, partial [Planctomycetaceae bacterium]|nr:hypothetical protein [Planctomycetaceae bacterium]
PCPHCGAPIFVLPLDCYAEAGLHRSSSKVTPSNRAVPGGVIAKLNRLAFWTRIRERRTQWGGRLSSVARSMGDWFKRRLSSLRLW